MQVRKRAFTLIELLVVIAIIAILAAILFPVFAKVREKARQIACLSSEKQIGLGVMQYLNDYDDRYPIPDYQFAQSNPPFTTWCYEIQPYIKSWPVFRCPDAEMDPWGAWEGGGASNPASDYSPGNQPGVGWWEWMPSYGMNAGYLAPNAGCSQPNHGVIDGAISDTESVLDEPANTVFAVDTKETPGYFAMHIADPPDGWTNPLCAYDGWGAGSFFDVPPGTNIPATNTDDTAVRHTGGINTIFCDGHAKWLTPGALAIGTNWHVGIDHSQVVVTDITKYLWATRKSGAGY